MKAKEYIQDYLTDFQKRLSWNRVLIVIAGNRGEVVNIFTSSEELTDK